MKSTNPELSQKLEVMAAAQKERGLLMASPILRTLFFELTDGCNLRCVHCGSSCGPEKARFLSLELIKKTLQSVKDNMGTGTTMIVLTGGEPLLHPDFLSIIKLIDEMGFRFGITTNATLIDKAMAESLRDAHIMSIGFSLDGDKSSHDRFRGNPHAYSKAIEGMKNFVEVCGKTATTMVTSVIHPGNIDQLQSLFEECKRLGVDYFRPINVEPIGRANAHPELFLDKRGFKTLFDFIKTKRGEGSLPQVTYGCSHALPLEYELEIREYPFLCMAGLQIASVLVNGDIYACLDIERREELVQGNVGKDDFYSVWEKGFSFFRRERTDVSYCRDCPNKAFCNGDSAHTWNYDEGRPNLCLRKWFESQ